MALRPLDFCMSKDKRNIIILSALLMVLVGIVVKNFVFSDDGSDLRPQTSDLRPRSAIRHPKADRAGSQGAEPAEGYRPLPLQVLGRRWSGDLQPSRNLFVYHIPPPPPERAPPPPPPPPLSLTAIRPSSVYAGQKEFTLEVSGVRLPQDARIFLNGRPLSTSVASPTQLEARVQKSLIASPGQLPVEVRNAMGDLYSNALTLYVQDPPKPTYKYVGRIANLVFLAKGPQDRELAFLGDTVESRWRVADISEVSVTLEDVTIGIAHQIPLERPAEGAGAESAPDTGFQAGFIQRPNPRRAAAFEAEQVDDEEPLEEPPPPPPPQPQPQRVQPRPRP